MTPKTVAIDMAIMFRVCIRASMPNPPRSEPRYDLRRALNPVSLHTKSSDLGRAAVAVPYATMANIIAPAIIEAICPATLAETACMSRKLLGSSCCAIL